MTARLPSLNGLRAFEAAARHLSFTLAASELNVTQTAISHQIRRLEEELGIRLFVRQNRALALTPEARDYLPGVRAAFNDLRLATDRLLRAGLSSHTADLVVRTVTAARELTAWWPAERTRVQAPADLAAIAQPIFGRSPQEQLHIAIVDGRNGLLDLHHVYTGTATGTSVRIGELLRPVLEAHGVGFAAVHNHPSGDPEPSDEDLRLTSELLAAARLLDIEFLDHLVIGHGRWVSIRSKQPSIWGAEAP